MLQDYIDEFLARTWGRVVAYAVGFLVFFGLALVAIMYFSDVHIKSR